MVNFRVQETYDFYKKFIYNEELQCIMRDYMLSIPGSVHSRNWETFGAVLTGDKGKQAHGSDLQEHEIKSAIEGGNFEYQYHKHGGQQKLAEDMRVNHIFISYSSDYKDVDVRIMEGEKLREIFLTWLPKLITNYTELEGKQRYRKNISYNFVKQNGRLIMQIRNGQLSTIDSG